MATRLLRSNGKVVQYFRAGGVEVFTVPSGVHSVMIEACGAGGGGGSSVVNGGGGGGGGGYARTDEFTVTPGQSIWVNTAGGAVAGAAGTNAWINASANAQPSSTAQGVVGVGGNAGANGSAVSPGNGGAGGSTTNSIGTTKFSGGNGANGSGTTGGGGGGSSNSNGNGSAGSGSTGGARGASALPGDDTQTGSAGINVAGNPAGSNSCGGAGATNLGSPTGSGSSWAMISYTEVVNKSSLVAPSDDESLIERPLGVGLVTTHSDSEALIDSSSLSITTTQTDADALAEFSNSSIATNQSRSDALAETRVQSTATTQTDSEALFDSRSQSSSFSFVDVETVAQQLGVSIVQTPLIVEGIADAGLLSMVHTSAVLQAMFDLRNVFIVQTPTDSEAIAEYSIVATINDYKAGLEAVIDDKTNSIVLAHESLHGLGQTMDSTISFTQESFQALIDLRDLFIDTSASVDPSIVEPPLENITVFTFNGIDAIYDAQIVEIVTAFSEDDVLAETSGLAIFWAGSGTWGLVDFGLEGTAYDSTGTNVIPDVEVIVFRDATPYVEEARLITNDDGEWAIGLDPAFTYWISYLADANDRAWRTRKGIIPFQVPVSSGSIGP